MAGRFSVEAVFKAVDKITGPVDRMQARIQGMTKSASMGLGNLDKSLGRVTGAMSSGVVNVAKFGGAIIAATGAGVAAAIMQVADAADELVNRSDRLQFPIEALQEWQFVAEQSGVSVDEFDKSLEKFTKNVGAAKLGTGALASALSRNPTQLAGVLEKLKNAKGVSEALQIYTSALHGIKDPMVKASLATAAFGKDAMGMVNIANLGADAIEKLRLEQRENGVMSAENAAAAEAFGDSLNSLQNSLTGLVTGVLGPMFPMLKTMVDGWRQWIVTNKDLIKTKVLAFFESAKTKIGALVDAASEFSSKYDLPGLLGKTVDLLADMAKWLADNKELIVNIIVPFVVFAEAVSVLNGVMALANALAMTNPWLLLAVGLIVLSAYVYTARDDIAQFGADVMAWIDQLSPEVKALALVVGSIATAFGVVKGAILLVKGATVAYTAVTKAFQGAMITAKLAMYLFNLALAANPIGAVVLAVLSLIGAGVLLMQNWDDVKAYFLSLWDSIGGVIEKITSAMGFGGKITVAAEDPKKGDAFVGPPRASPQVITPADRIAKTITETRESSSAEVTIKDGTGRAEVTRGKLGNGVKVIQSGAF